jgi:hypothetical protein
MTRRCEANQHGRRSQGSSTEHHLVPLTMRCAPGEGAIASLFLASGACPAGYLPCAYGLAGGTVTRKTNV